ncbi:MAG: HAMP domain-containing histidine kinase [Deltaproteobacteria bacterium]|nr:HAMP domain-containing histidine kinase [Deltaproteobacteria bacterium]
MKSGAGSLAKELASIRVLVPAVIVAATALAYYSYRYAHELARRGEQSIMDTNRDLAEGMVKRIEQLVVDSDRTLFELVDLRNLREFPRRWSDIVRLSPAIESALILDSGLRIVPDGYVSKKHSKAEVELFRRLFEREIRPKLDLESLAPDEHKHLHREFDGRYYLISYTRRNVDGRPYYIALEGDLAYLVGEVFPESFAGVDARRLYQVIDEHDWVVFGHPFAGIPSKYMVTLTFSKTLYKWRLRMAPREAPVLMAKESTRRAFDVVLIALSAMTVFVGLGLLAMTVRNEQRVSQLKSEFIANVSHELKTPLSLIRMFAELLASGRTKGPESAREYAEIITRESERLSRLIDNVLDFARIERGKVAYEFRVGDLAEVVARGLDVYRHRLEREGMKLQVAIQSNLPPVMMDENAMTLLLLNLLDNAIKYAAEGKELAVSVSTSDERVRLSVRDRGPGIDPQEEDRIFERFYRAKNVRGRPVRGSGIGLSLVKHIAEAHGGGVTVESVQSPAREKGSTFTAWLPVYEAQNPQDLGSSLSPKEETTAA